MERKEFIKTCGMGCLGLIAGGTILSSCSSLVYIQKTVTNDQVNIRLSEFLVEGEIEKYKRYILVKPDVLSHPIVVYRKSESEYRAILLKCTHQGTKLNVYGDLISCPAHGSEFSNTGEVISDPARRPLRSFASSVIQNELVINLNQPT